MIIIRNIFLDCRKIIVFFCIVICSIFRLPICFADLPAKPYSKTSNITDKVQRSSNWQQLSYEADGLLDRKRYFEAESILNSILPQAKKEAPDSLDYALTLCRLGSALYPSRKYTQAVAKLDEAIKILNHSPASSRQRQILWRCLGTKVAVLERLQKISEAESLARKAVAYSIAFPEVATKQQVKIAYLLLYDSLVMQNKSVDAEKVKSIMNNL